MISRPRALALLSECTGDDIWSEEHCRLRGVPASWISELIDAYESNPQRDTDTIYVDERRTNQYRGVRDVDLALRLGEVLGIDTRRAIQFSLGRREAVQAIKNAIMEGD